MGAGARLNEFVGLQSELAIKRIYANAPSYNETLKFYQDNGFILSALSQTMKDIFRISSKLIA